jgi:hypothetical protein
VEDNTAVDPFAPVLIAFKTEVVDEKISIDPFRKGDHGGNHLDSRADGIDNLGTLVNLRVRIKDIIDSKGRLPGCRHLANIRAPDGFACSRYDASSSRVFSDSNFNSSIILCSNIFPDAGLNMFILAHSNRS